MTDEIRYAIPPASFIPELPPEHQRRRVVLVACPNEYQLELMGPMNVLKCANVNLEYSGRSDMGYDWEVVGSETGVMFDEGGLKVLVDRSFKTVSGEIDTLVITPMDLDRLLEGNDDFFAWIRYMSTRVRRLVCVCSGTYVLAAAGVLNQRRAVTHWDLIPDFKARFPAVRVEPDPIYVKDDHIYSSAGMTAGLDLMLTLVEEDFGQAISLRTAQGLVMFLKRPGNQAQFSTQLSHSFSGNSSFAKLQAYIYENLDGDLRIEKLSEQVGMSPRNFSRAFTRELGVAPGRFVERCRLEIARQRLEETSTPISAIAENCGYRSADAMRLAFERNLGTNPRDYRQRFTSSLRAKEQAA